MSPEDRVRCVERYTERFRQHGYDPRALGWGQGGRQEIRFAALTAIGCRETGSVLDVGCGFADLYGYLTRLGWSGRYVGVDLVPALLEEAARRHPHAELELRDILEQPPDQTFDWVFAAGIFNAQLVSGGASEYIAAMLTRMFSLARIGVAADFMTTRVDFQHPGAFHFDPVEAVELVSRLTRRFVLRNDYLPYEFCLHLYRHDGPTADSRFATHYDAAGRVMPAGSAA